MDIRVNSDMARVAGKPEKNRLELSLDEDLRRSCS